MKGWKTFGFNLATGLVGVAILAFEQMPIQAEWVGIAITGLSTLNIALRAITNSPIFKDE